MRRRQSLALAGSLLAGAGCLGGPESAPPSTSTSTATATTPTNSGTESRPPPSLSVAVEALQPAIVRLQTDYLTVGDASARHLFLDVTVEAGRLPREELELAVDGETYAPMPETEARPLWRFYGAASGYGLGAGGVVWFRLPSSVPADPTIRLRWPGGEWPLPEPYRRRLAASSPPLSWSVEAPSELDVGTPPTVRASVANDGDLPGRFVAGLSRAGPRVASIPVRRVSARVPANETRTVETTADVTGQEVDAEDLGDGEADVRFTLRTVGETVTRAVRYVDAD
ncbi:MAG: hypothetical protein ABEJ79_08280 [Halolamina sp.]